MVWANYIDRVFDKSTFTEVGHHTVVDLFAGCGGLALGFKAAGFSTIGYEMNEAACATYAHNIGDPCIQKKLEGGENLPDCDILIGGPPCQPFSVGGKQHGTRDHRNGFPIFMDAVRRLEPKLALIENVRGLLYQNKWYLEETTEQLEQLGYEVHYKLLNARHYGVPQNRERVIVVATRVGWAWPTRHDAEVTAGEALGELATQSDDSSFFLTPNIDAYIARYEAASKCINPRDLHLDKPARTLTCRNLHGKTGDMHRILLPDGRRRMLTVREAARLQSFPDWFEFNGKSSQQFDQIGNSVAPLFAYALAENVRRVLQDEIKREPSFRQQLLFAEI